MEPFVPQFLVVPDQPGVAFVALTAGSERDEVDSIVDELFGEDTTDGPGVADVVLFTVGLAVVVWGLLVSSNGLVIVGAIIGSLGIVLPVRSAARRLRARRSSAAHVRPLVLDVSSSINARLAESYASVLDAATSEDTATMHVALLAVHEVATLLDGHPPTGAAEFEYVTARADALASLAESLRARPVRATRPDNAAQIEARNEIDALTGTGALAQIESLIEDHRTDG
jgi:hypothetical protein